MPSETAQSSRLPDSMDVTTAALRRAEQLDALDSILPFDRRDRLADLLTDEDVATLKHLARAGMGPNSLRALASDLAYLETWAKLATGRQLVWPAPEALVVKFVAHHLWDPAEREANPAHGMPDDVADVLKQSGLLRSDGPHAPSTVRRRLSSWSTLTQWRGLEGGFSAPSVRQALRLAVRASAAPRRRKSAKAVTADVLTAILGKIGADKLVDLRDRALLMAAFASGGRRRSEVASLRVEQIHHDDPVPANPADPQSPKLTALTLHLGRTKTNAAESDQTAILIGKPADALLLWLKHAAISSGPIFRAIDQWGNIKPRALDAQSVNLILKSRINAAGLDPAAYSAHGLRSGYLTEAARQGVSLPEAMAQSGHKSVQQAASYYNEAERKLGRAARLIA